MILALVLIIFCSTTAFAQKHRHSPHDNGGNTEVVNNTTTTNHDNLDTVTLINTNGLKVTATTDEIDKLNQIMEDLDITTSEYDETDSPDGGNLFGALNSTVDTLNQGHFFDYALLIPIIAVLGLFFAPVFIVGFILLYRYKRRKQRDQIVLAAINRGVEVPEEYRSNTAKTSYNNTTHDANAPVNNEAMNKGIRRIVTGIGIWILGASINLGILMGVGLFIIVLGAGEVLIHYLNNRGTGVRSEGTYRGSEGTYRQQPTSTDSLQKHEGTYEKSE